MTFIWQFVIALPSLQPFCLLLWRKTTTNQSIESKKLLIGEQFHIFNVVIYIFTTLKNKFSNKTTFFSWLLFRILHGERPYWWIHEIQQHDHVMHPVSLQQYSLTCETGPGMWLNHVTRHVMYAPPMVMCSLHAFFCKVICFGCRFLIPKF